MKIIDAHLHIGRFKNDLYSDKEHSNGYLQNLSFGIVSSVKGVVDSQKKANKKTFDHVQARNNSFKGLIWINPYDIGWEENAKRCAGASNFVGIKIHPPLNNFRPSSELLGPVFRFAGEHNLPVAIHTGRPDNTNAGKFREFIEKFPNVTFLLYHMQPLDEAIELAKKYKNVFLGTSGRNVKEIEKAIKNCGSDKIVYGSDEHLVYQKKKPINLLDEIQKNFAKKDQENILYNNAKKIFNLK